MRIPIIVRVVFAALVVGASVMACHDPESRIPTSPSAPVIVSVDIGGPASVAPGQAAQLVANAHMSDGTVKTVASGTGVVWRIVDSGILQISQTGVVTAGQTVGERVVSVDVTVANVLRRASRTVLVLPTGTFRVVGSVKENASPSLPVASARVEVTSGGASTLTDGTGQYRLYGVPAVADLQVSRTGYATETRHVTLSTNGTENFVLQFNGPLLSLNGNFTLTIDVVDSCPGSRPLAAGLQHRSYDASVTQSGSSIDVLLTESRFRVNSIARGNRFTGRALGGGATFTLEFYDSYYYAYYGPTSYPNVAESLADGTYLVPQGSALVSGTSSGLTGTLNGGLYQFDGRFPAGSPAIVASCSGTLQFGLTPR